MSSKLVPGDLITVTNGNTRMWSTHEDATGMGREDNSGEIAWFRQGKLAVVIAVIDIPGTNGCLLALYGNVLGYVYSSRIINVIIT